MLRYYDNGIIEIDNSAAERALRGVAIDRRNYLFADADSGGERATAVYSLIGTAKLNGIDPEAWLRHVLTHIADHPGQRPPALELRRAVPFGLNNTPLPSGVMPSVVVNPSRTLR